MWRKNFQSLTIQELIYCKIRIYKQDSYYVLFVLLNGLLPDLDLTHATPTMCNMTPKVLLYLLSIVQQ